jgi:hypothetical protein
LSNEDVDEKALKILDDKAKNFTDDEAKTKEKYHEVLQHYKILEEVNNSIKKSNLRFEGIIHRINATFWSILIMNWVLIGMAIVMFAGAVYAAIGGRFDITALLTASGFGSILAVFRFSMDRVQTNLGDQIQVEVAYNSYIKQIQLFDEHFDFTLKTDDIKKINTEIRESTLNTMMLIQNYTKIGTQSSSEPWITTFPIRYGKIEVPNEVYLGEKIKMKATLRNDCDKAVALKSCVIAVRPPHGTPEGGPFNYDFAVFPGQTIDPHKEITLEAEKTIESNLDPAKVNLPVPKDFLEKEWYAFIACETNDEVWHNDTNKYTFTVHDKRQATNPQLPVNPQP